MDVMLPSLDGYLIGELFQWTQLLVVTHVAVRVVRIFERRHAARQPDALPRRRARRLARKLDRLQSQLRQSRDAEYFARALLSRKMQE